MVEAVLEASWRQIHLPLPLLCVGSLSANIGRQKSLGRFGRTTRSTEPGPAHFATSFGWWATQYTGVTLSCGPQLIFGSFCLYFGPILHHVESPCVGLRLSLSLLHVFPCFRMLIPEMLIEWRLDKMLVRDDSSHLILSNVDD